MKINPPLKEQTWFIALIRSFSYAYGLSLIAATIVIFYVAYHQGLGPGRQLMQVALIASGVFIGIFMFIIYPLQFFLLRRRQSLDKKS